MKILVINAGSSTLKFQLIDTVSEDTLASGAVERIGFPESFARFKSPKGKDQKELPVPDHNVATDIALKYLTDEKLGVVKSLDEIDAVGHRIVSAGPKYDHTVVVTDEVLADFEKNLQYSPLHLPGHIKGIKACMKAMPNTIQTATFDTAFHSTMPEKAYLYAIPYELYTDHQIRRYGFHGSSHQFIRDEVERILGSVADKKIVSCHIGSGASVCAIKNGKSVDTSMGYTPLEGVIMGTRSGDIDASILPQIAKIYNLKNIDEVVDFLNKKCGLLGITGYTNDMRDIEANLDKHRENLAMDMTAYRIAKYVGAYSAAMGGIDVLVFTAGAGENTAEMRKRVCEYLEFLGVNMDYHKNKVMPRGTVEDISLPTSRVKIYRIPTNEELVIARETAKLAK